MPVAAALPYISAGASILGGLKGLSGGASGGGGAGSTYNPVPTYQPTGLGMADTNYQGLSGTMTSGVSGLGAQYMPAYGAQSDGIVNNPYSGYAQGGAQTASDYGFGGLAPMQQQGAGSLMGLGGMSGGWAGGVQPWAEQLMQTGFDPQGALYGRNQQQMMDRQNAINSMNGVAGTPYGAGVAGQTANNFDLDWQDRQLGRQTSASQAYTGLGGLFNSLVSGAGNAYTGASNLGGSAYNTMAGAAQLPYSTYLGQRTDALGGLGSSFDAQRGIYGQQADAMTALYNYLNLGNSAASGANTAAANTANGNRAGQQANFNQQQTYGSQVGSGLSGLAKLFGDRGGAVAGDKTNYGIY